MTKKYIDAEDLQVIIEKRINNIESCPFIEAEFGAEMRREGKILAYNDILTLIDSLQQKTSEISLKKFTEKMEDWKARFNRPDDIPIKATMAFTGRMFYMYPDVAREWYDNLSKATQD